MYQTNSTGPAYIKIHFRCSKCDLNLVLLLLNGQIDKVLIKFADKKGPVSIVNSVVI